MRVRVVRGVEHVQVVLSGSWHEEELTLRGRHFRREHLARFPVDEPDHREADGGSSERVADAADEPARNAREQKFEEKKEQVEHLQSNQQR